MSAETSESDKTIKTLQEKLADLEKSNERHRENVSQRRLLISEYCDKLRAEVDLSIQSAIDQLNQQNQDMLEEIGKYEKELLDLLEPKESQSEKPTVDYDEQILSKNDALIRRIKEALANGPAMAMPDVRSEIAKLEEMAIELAEAVESFNDRIFAKKHMHFIENEKFFSMYRNVGRLQCYSTGQVLKPKTSYISDVQGITHLALMPNGNVLSGCKNGDVIVWSPDFKNIIHKCIHDMYLEEVSALVALSNDRFACAFNSIERCIRIYHATNSNRFFPYTSLYEHSDYISGLCALSNGDLLSCSYDGTILLRSSAYGYVSTKQIGEFGERSIFSMTVLNDDLIAVSDSLTPLKVYSIRENKTIVELFNLSQYYTSLGVLDERQLVSSSFGTIKIWDYKEDKASPMFFADRDDHAPLLVLQNRNIASCNMLSEIEIWDSVEGMLLKILPSFWSKVSCMIQLQNGELLSIYQDNMVHIWAV